MRERIVIFGAGLGGQRAARFFADRFDILGFVDNNPRLRGRRIAGYEVLSPDHLRAKPVDRVLIASGRGYEIYDQLLSLGVADRAIEFVAADVMGGRYEPPVRLLRQIAVALALVVAGIGLMLLL